MRNKASDGRTRCNFSGCANRAKTVVLKFGEGRGFLKQRIHLLFEQSALGGIKSAGDGGGTNQGKASLT